MLDLNSIVLPEYGVNPAVFKKTKAENEKQIRYRDQLIAGLFIVIALLIMGWMKVQSDISLHYPPDLRSGATMKVGEIPDYEVFAFVGNVFTYLNTWNEDGQYDYLANRKRLRAFFTLRYRKQIKEDISKLMDLGELQGRTRTIQPLSNDFYKQENVEIKNGSTWVVRREYRIKEHLNGTLMKDVAMKFAIRVVVHPVPHEANPWQIAIDGFEEEPTRIPYLKGELE